MAVKSSGLIALKIENHLEKSMQTPGMWMDILNIRSRKILTISQWIFNSSKAQLFIEAKHLFSDMSDHERLSIVIK